MDQPDLLCRPAITAEHQAVGRVLRLALEMIRPRPVLALLHPEGLDGELHRAAPRIVERRLVARAPPIFVGEPHRIAERIDLPLPLGDAGLHLGLVRRSEEHTSELQSLMRISYAVFGLKKKNKY